MRAWGELKDPENLTITIQMEMTVGQAQQIKEQLSGERLPYWPYGAFCAAIGEVISRVTKQAYASIPEQKSGE